MSSNYQKFIAVLGKWPRNAHKNDQDYGNYLREMIKNRKFNEDPFPGSQAENTEMINSLLRLAQNKHANRYSHHFKVAATGLPLDRLNLISQNELINLKKKENS